jgi:hypothetical protein
VLSFVSCWLLAWRLFWVVAAKIAAMINQMMMVLLVMWLLFSSLHPCVVNVTVSTTIDAASFRGESSQQHNTTNDIEMSSAPYYDDLALAPPEYTDIAALEVLPSGHYADGLTHDVTQPQGHYAKIDDVADKIYDDVFMGDQVLADENAAAQQRL